MQHDFRSIYASALKDWFGIANPESILGQSFPILPIFKAGQSGTQVLHQPDVMNVGNYPNPFHGATTFNFTSEGGYVVISLLDLSGRVLQIVAEGNYPSGTHRVTYSRGDLRPGNYFYQVKVNGSKVTKQLVVI
jgi:hypothetical protein